MSVMYYEIHKVFVIARLLIAERQYHNCTVSDSAAHSEVLSPAIKNILHDAIILEFKKQLLSLTSNTSILELFPVTSCHGITLQPLPSHYEKMVNKYAKPNQINCHHISLC